MDDLTTSRKRSRNLSTVTALAPRPIAGVVALSKISDFIEIPDGERFAAARAALSLVDQVHGINHLEINVSSGRLRGDAEAAYGIASDEPGRKSGYMVFNQRKRVSKLSFLEELGHSFDHQQFSPLAGYATDAGNSDIERVLEQIRSSETFQNIATYRIGQQIVLNQNGTARYIYVDNHQDLEYEQSIVEWFARAYVQFIAVSSGDAALLQELGSLRTSETYELLYPYAWPDAQFEPIARSLETVFREKGWIR